ncbi:MAG: glycosyltransferase [Cyclobacteriaceae bacterium]|nr:glycosyltransferase [Cyclobacteriaceae bacterium]
MKVNIIMLVYNHESYLDESIRCVINQKTNFPFQLIIGDDASKDNSQQIIKNFHKNHPNIICPILRINNIGANYNFIDCLEKASGEYIAICEGDDYWTDPLKLQKQIDFLDQNPDYVLCYTDIQHYHEKDNTFIDLIQKDVDTVSLKDLFNKNYVTTLTAVFRNGLLKMPEDFQSLAIGDFPLFAMLAQFGKIKRLPMITGVYRIHNTNYFQGQSYLQKKLKVTEATEFLYRHFQPQYRPLAKERLIDHYYVLAVLYAKDHQLDDAFRYHKNMLGLMNHGWNVKAIRLKILLWIYQIRNKISS